MGVLEREKELREMRKINNYLKLIATLSCVFFVLTGCSSKQIEQVETVTIETITFEEIGSSLEKEIKESILEETISQEETIEHEKIIESESKEEVIYETKESEKIEEKQNEPLQFNVTDESGILYATTSVNIRELPSKDSNKIGHLSLSQEIEKTGICDNGWIKVLYNGIDGYINGKYLSEQKPEIIETPVQSEISSVIQNIGVSENLVKKINTYYMMIPENIRNSFVNNGWTLYVTNENFGKKYYGYDISILALTLYYEKVIYIDDREKAVTSVIHEFGHYIDCVSGFVTNSKEFGEIFLEECETFKTIHSTHSNNTSTPMEYFAEFYQEIILHPDSIKDSCPKTYEFILRYANALN